LDSLGTGTPIAGTPRTWAKDSELIGINFYWKANHSFFMSTWSASHWTKDHGTVPLVRSSMEPKSMSLRYCFWFSSNSCNFWTSELTLYLLLADTTSLSTRCLPCLLSRTIF
jgi:hypothetical protein